MVSAAGTGFPTCTDHGPWGSHALPADTRQTEWSRDIGVPTTGEPMPFEGLQTAPN